jgi:hypothetical protein
MTDIVSTVCVVAGGDSSATSLRTCGAGRPHQHGKHPRTPPLVDGRIDHRLNVGGEALQMHVVDDADDRSPLALVFHALAEHRLVGELAAREQAADDRDEWRTRAVLRREVAAFPQRDADRGEIARYGYTLLRFVPWADVLRTAARRLRRGALRLNRRARRTAAERWAVTRCHRGDTRNRGQARECGRPKCSRHVGIPAGQTRESGRIDDEVFSAEARIDLRDSLQRSRQQSGADQQ